MTSAIEYYYRQNRQHQMKIANAGGGALLIEPAGRTELSFGSAPYGEHAISAYASAKRTINFRIECEADVKAYKKRSRAAKKGWAKRRALVSS